MARIADIQADIVVRAQERALFSRQLLPFYRQLLLLSSKPETTSLWLLKVEYRHGEV